MDNTALSRIRENIQKHQQIGIVVGKNYSFDDIASALSLYLALKAAQKNVSVSAASEPLVEVSSLVGIDKVRTTLEADGGDLIVSFPYQDKAIEKVSYTLENGFLNIIVKAGEEGLSFTEKDIKYKRGGGFPSLLFIVGTPRLSDLGSLFNPDALKETTVINIDTKPENQNFGDVALVSPKSSSVSELMASMLVSLDLPFDVDIAQNLLAGISFATDNFQDQKTSAQAFEMCALLLKKGAIRTKIQKGKQNTSSQENSYEGGSPFPYQPYQDQVQQRRNEQPREQAVSHKQMGQHQQQSQPRPRSDFGNKLNELMQKQQQQRGNSPFAQQNSQQQSYNQQPQRQQQQSQPQPSQPQQQSQPSQQQQTQPPQQVEQKRDDEEAPPDWLTPKVYKSSTLV